MTTRRIQFTVANKPQVVRFMEERVDSELTTTTSSSQRLPNTDSNQQATRLRLVEPLLDYEWATGTWTAAAWTDDTTMVSQPTTTTTNATAQGSHEEWHNTSTSRIRITIRHGTRGVTLPPVLSSRHVSPRSFGTVTIVDVHVPPGPRCGITNQQDVNTVSSFTKNCHGIASLSICALPKFESYKDTMEYYQQKVVMTSKASSAAIMAPQHLLCPIFNTSSSSSSSSTIGFTVIPALTSNYQVRLAVDASDHAVIGMDGTSVSCVSFPLESVLHRLIFRPFFLLLLISSLPGSHFESPHKHHPHFDVLSRHIPGNRKINGGGTGSAPPKAAFQKIVFTPS